MKARRIGTLVSAAVCFMVLAGTLSSRGFLGDIGWDVSNGLWILQHGYVPLHNHLTTAMHGAPWGNSEWLWGLLTGFGFHLLGVPGVFLVELPVLAILALLMARATRPLDAYWGLLALLGAALALAPGINARPQIASFALFLLALLLIARYRESGRIRPLWVAAATGLLWVNLHGSVVLLPLVLLLELLFALPAERRRIAGPLVLSLLLLGAHPGGFAGMFSNLLHVGSTGNTAVIVEWLSPDFHVPGLWAGGAVLAGGLALLAPALYRARRHADLLLLLGCTAATLWAVRFLPYLVLLVLARGVEMLPPKARVEGAGSPPPDAARERRAHLLGGVVAVALLAFALTRPLFPARFPVGVLGYMQRHHITRVFNWYSVGASYEPYGIEPFLDGRDNIWDQSSWWPRYIAVTAGQYSVLRFLRQYDPGDRYVLWFARSPVALQLDSSPDWRRVEVDPNRLNPFRSAQGPYVLWQRVH